MNSHDFLAPRLAQVAALKMTIRSSWHSIRHGPGAHRQKLSRRHASNPCGERWSAMVRPRLKVRPKGRLHVVGEKAKLFRHFASSPNLSNKLVQTRPFQQCKCNSIVTDRPLPGLTVKSRCHGLTARHGPVQSDIKAVRGGFELLRRWRHFPCKSSSSINSRACSPRCLREMKCPATFDIWTQPQPFVRT
jgi:hypothetical protein